MEAFRIKLHSGQWHIHFLGRWYGPFMSMEQARRFAVDAAQTAETQFGLPTPVEIEHPDGKIECIVRPTTVRTNSARFFLH